MFFGISVKNRVKKFLGSKSDLGTIYPLGPKVTFWPQKLFYVIFDADSEKHIFSPFGDTFENFNSFKNVFLITLSYLKFFFVKIISTNKSVTAEIYKMLIWVQNFSVFYF